MPLTDDERRAFRRHADPIDACERIEEAERVRLTARMAGRRAALVAADPTDPAIFNIDHWIEGRVNRLADRHRPALTPWDHPGKLGEWIDRVWAVRGEASRWGFPPDHDAAKWREAFRSAVRRVEVFAADLAPSVHDDIGRWGAFADPADRLPAIRAWCRAAMAPVADPTPDDDKLGPATPVETTAPMAPIGFLSVADIRTAYPGLTGGEREAVRKRLARWRHGGEHDDECRQSLDIGTGRTVWSYPAAVVAERVAGVRERPPIGRVNISGPAPPASAASANVRENRPPAFIVIVAPVQPNGGRRYDDDDDDDDDSR